MRYKDIGLLVKFLEYVPHILSYIYEIVKGVRSL